MQGEQLKRSELINYLKESAEASQIIERNILRENELIKTFRRLSVNLHSQDIRTFALYDYAIMLTKSYFHLNLRQSTPPHKFCVDISTDLAINSNHWVLSQRLINLIINSTHHAFPPGAEGQITINAKIEYDSVRNKKLVFLYQDNGIGMDERTIDNIYKPFFTLAKETGNCGLGMHICYNIIMKVLRGTIDCRPELGKGAKFTITFSV